MRRRHASIRHPEMNETERGVVKRAPNEENERATDSIEAQMETRMPVVPELALIC